MLSDYACNFDPKSGADLRLWPPRWQHSLRRCQRLWHGFWWLWVVPHYDGRWYLFATCHKITKLKSSWNLSFHLIIFTPFSSLFTSEKKRRRMWMCLRLSRGAWRRNIRCAWSVRSTGMDEADGFRLFRFSSNVVVFRRTLSLFLSFVIFALFCVCVFFFFLRNVWIFLVNFWFPDYC